MAGALVDVLLERLATLALDRIEQELKLVGGVKQEIKNLTKKLEAIRAVLEDAEQRQVMEASVKVWLNDLNDVSYDMDDVLDEWITRVLMHQMEKQETQSANALATAKKKVCFSFLSSYFGSGEANQLFRRHEIATKIKELNERLALIDENKKQFSFQNINPRVPELPQRQKTTSLPNVKTFGRDDEKKFIVSKLLSESSEGNEGPLIIPIVGIGGMGKTSLANLVYNDEKIKSHFEESIWVCVSDPFEEIKIAKAIAEGLGKDNTSNELDHLMKTINESIKDKKFLLVLDDVWSPEQSQWEELIKPLRNGAIGSTVLVTTRMEDVAALISTQKISLKALSDAFCLSLFYYSAGMDENNVSKEFHDIGLEIVKKCNGLPLVAKTLGSLMRNKKTIHQWQVVLNRKTLLKEVKIKEDVFRPLLLSYYDLTPATKRCLLYCATIPKDYKFNKNNLIELWMSQDYLNVKESKENIIVGQNCFDDLMTRSFFQDIKELWNGNIACKIHDIVRVFLQYLTEDECLILDASERRDVSVDKVRHLTLVHAAESDSLKSFLPNYKKLRTLIAIESSKNSIGPIFELIVQLKCLRTLILCGRLGKEIPETIRGLIHLRYLDLSDNKELKELPSALGSLYNLQTLRLVGCKSLKKVDVGRLINLRHLYVEYCIHLQLIKGVEKLTDLQRLDWFVVPDGDEGNKLEDLKDLNQLQGSLTIYISGGANMAENAAIMVNKAHLLQLRLKFWRDDEGKDRELMNGLKPHPGLEYLSIGGYHGGAFSDWLSSLNKLRVLTLHECLGCGFLPPLGELASLESLSIDGLDVLSKVGVEFLGIDDGQTSSSFPKLKQLTFKYMPSWEEWEGAENNNITIMTCLSQLTIWDCAKLKALPDFLWKTPLQKLHIGASPILQDLYRQGTGEEWAKIKHIPSIEI